MPVLIWVARALGELDLIAILCLSHSHAFTWLFVDELTISKLLPRVRAIGFARLDKKGIAIEAEAITFLGKGVLQLTLFDKSRLPLVLHVIWSEVLLRANVDLGHLAFLSSIIWQVNAFIAALVLQFEEGLGGGGGSNPFYPFLILLLIACLQIYCKTSVTDAETGFFVLPFSGFH